MASPTVSRPTPPQVVIAYLDGRRVRGYVFDFSAIKDRCRIFPSANATADQGEVVDLKTLKAIFFLQEPSGDGTTTTRSGGPANRRKLEVIFRDGERLEGTTEGFSRERLGFFMVPEDPPDHPTGKILRVFVINVNVKQAKWL